MLFASVHRDAGILGRVRGGKVTVVLALLHVGAVRFQHARVGARLGENLAQDVEVEAQRRAEAETLPPSPPC